MNRAHNFSAGPATLPTEVLVKAQAELLDYKGAGASIMEVSHRGKEFDPVFDSAKARMKRLLGLSEKHHVMFLQGGATHQFFMIPMNFLNKGDSADYLNTGVWSQKAIKEARIYGDIKIPYSSEQSGFNRVPSANEVRFNPSAKFVHYTSNNTIYGTQFSTEPNTNGIPLVCDASSDFLSRPIDIDKYGLIYAGAQKNLGPSGAAVVILDDEFLKKAHTDNIPTYLQYGSHTGELYHTPPTFTIYLIDLVLEWLENLGGVAAMEIINKQKAKMLYCAIDDDDFYENQVETDSRSKMNVLFRIKNRDLESVFLKEAEAHNLIGLKAHRSTGGIRASLYNAVSLQSVEILVDFMSDFRRRFG
ncbi:3-phosphoserine/phosphohydroxythreonine transaminase [bacterium]|nr:MAG: 3-phosphoserine/phosphohydroxythreonine transaminase [bacterium]